MCCSLFSTKNTIPKSHVCHSPKSLKTQLMFRARRRHHSLYSLKLSKLALSCVMVSPPAYKHLRKSFRLLPILHGPPINYQNSIIPLTWCAPFLKNECCSTMSAPRLLHQKPWNPTGTFLRVLRRQTYCLEAFWGMQ